MDGCRIIMVATSNSKRCGVAMEDLRRFVPECQYMEEWRGELCELQRPRLERVERLQGQFLFEKRNESRRRRVLYQMWREKEEQMKRLEEEQRRSKAELLEKNIYEVIQVQFSTE